MSAVAKPLAVLALTLAIAILSALGIATLGSGASGKAASLVADAGILLAAVACLLRTAVRDSHARTWGYVGAGLVAWGIGDLYWTIVLDATAEPPVPSPADVGYLAFYPFLAAAVWHEARGFLRAGTAAAIVDAGIVAGAAVAVVLATVFPRILDVSGDPAAVATNLAYPVGDLMLIGAVAAAGILLGGRPPRAWLALGAGLAVFVTADSAYLYNIATDAYVPGDWPDHGWLLGAILMGAGAWQPQASTRRSEAVWRSLLPLGISAMAIVVLTTKDHFQRIEPAALWVSSITLTAVIVRLMVALRDNRRLAESHLLDATTDSLTRLRNRRALTADLDRIFERTSVLPCLVGMFGLDRFKHYNDTFGHAAGDWLLEHMAARLRGAVGPHGMVYRLGGDEFCVVTATDDLDDASVVAAAAAALCDRGPGFDITASCGVVAIPSEAASTAAVLRLAGERLSRAKAERPEAALHQARDVLLAALGERQPDLAAHAAALGESARAVARRLGVPEERLDAVAQAAELYDVGKIAVPDAVLLRPSPLTPTELRLLRRHTAIGARILSAVPSLRAAAPIVRASQEHHDGSGFPDRLAGEEIPLEARIVGACAAFDAMTTPRPYRTARSAEEAMGELRRGAGTQFDPDVVNACCAEFAQANVSAPSPQPEAPCL